MTDSGGFELAQAHSHKQHKKHQYNHNQGGSKMETIKWAVNKMPKTEDSNLPVMGLDEVRKARTFHESFPQYSVTPLAKLDQMASYLGLKEVYVKDESYRFGLNAFIRHGPLHSKADREGCIGASI